MLSRKRAETDDPPNLAELLSLMAFYKQVRPEVLALDLLKYGGFKIAGLRDTQQASVASLGHRLAWNEKLGYGLCTCGKWQAEEDWAYEMAQTQHTMHKRRNT